MSTGEQVDEQLKPRRASERRSSLQQIEELKVRRASERRASVELSAELVDPARTRGPRRACTHCVTHRPGSRPPGVIVVLGICPVST